MNNPPACSPGHSASHPVIGILGGMGPEATVDLMRRVIEATPASDDRDHIHMIVDNNPKIPSRMAALIDDTGESPAPVLGLMARGLVGVGANALAMPCNSAHAYLEDIQKVVSIPVLNMVGLTATELASLSPPPARVGILASTAVNRTGLYADALNRHNMEAVIPAPDQQDALMDVIRAVKRADRSGRVREALQDIARNLVSQDVHTLVLACTELSVLAHSITIDVPVIDALDVLVQAIVAFGLNQDNSSARAFPAKYGSPEML